MKINNRNETTVQSGHVIRHFGDQIYVLLWEERGGREAWGSLCAETGVDPFIYLRLSNQKFAPSRRCPAHKAREVKVRHVVRVVDNYTAVDILVRAKANIDTLGVAFDEHVDAWPAVAAALLHEYIESTGATAPTPALGSGWCREFAGGVGQFCDTCGTFSVMLSHPREQSAWPLVRCLNCRKANRRLPSEFAASLTDETKDSIYRHSVKAVEQEAARWPQPISDAQRREALVNHAKFALAVLKSIHHKEHGQ